MGFKRVEADRSVYIYSDGQVRIFVPIFFFFFFFKSGPCAPIYYAVLEHNPRATLLVTSVLH